MGDEDVARFDVGGGRVGDDHDPPFDDAGRSAGAGQGSGIDGAGRRLRLRLRLLGGRLRLGIAPEHPGDAQRAVVGVPGPPLGHHRHRVGGKLTGELVQREEEDVLGIGQDPVGGQDLLTLGEWGVDPRISSLEFSRDGCRLRAVGWRDGTCALKTWDATDVTARSLALSRDGMRLYALTADGIRVIDPLSGQAGSTCSCLGLRSSRVRWVFADSTSGACLRANLYS